MSDHALDASRYTLWKPTVAGWWILPGSTSASGVNFSMPAKPNWVHRKMMQWLMGWKWEDSNGS